MSAIITIGRAVYAAMCFSHQWDQEDPSDDTSLYLDPCHTQLMSQFYRYAIHLIKPISQRYFFISDQQRFLEASIPCKLLS